MNRSFHFHNPPPSVHCHQYVSLNPTTTQPPLYEEARANPYEPIDKMISSKNHPDLKAAPGDSKMKKKCNKSKKSLADDQDYVYEHHDCTRVSDDECCQFSYEWRTTNPNPACSRQEKRQ